MTATISKAVFVAAEQRHFIPSTMSPGPAQKRLALAVVFCLLVVTIVVAGPLSNLQPGRVDGFVPAFATALLISDSITAVLLFVQFSILRSRSLLAISSGYVFTALIMIDTKASSSADTRAIVISSLRVSRAALNLNGTVPHARLH